MFGAAILDAEPTWKGVSDNRPELTDLLSCDEVHHHLHCVQVNSVNMFVLQRVCLEVPVNADIPAAWWHPRDLDPQPGGWSRRGQRLWWRDVQVL